MYFFFLLYFTFSHLADENTYKDINKLIHTQFL